MSPCILNFIGGWRRLQQFRNWQQSVYSFNICKFKFKLNCWNWVLYCDHTHQMSDVEMGGATVFPNLGLRIAPSKVSDLVRSIWCDDWYRGLLHFGGTWRNLVMVTCAHVMLDAQSWWAPNGVYYSTLFFCCTLLYSSCFATVCNKWIHERGQEFRRRCSLSPDE